MSDSALIPADWRLPPEIVGRLGDRAGRQRAMLAAGHLLLVLHHPPGPDERERRARLFWRDPDGGWRSSHHGDVEPALDRHLDEYSTVVDKFDRAEDYADSIAELRSILEGLAPLTRATRHQHQALQDARNWAPHDRHLINLRDRAYELERSAELLYQDVQNTLEFVTAKQAEEQARSAHAMAVAAHRLNLLAAFFFPVATLATILGMDFPPAVEAALPSPWPHVAAVMVGLSLGALLAFFLWKAGPVETKPERK